MNGAVPVIPSRPPFGPGGNDGSDDDDDAEAGAVIALGAGGTVVAGPGGRTVDGHGRSRLDELELLESGDVVVEPPHAASATSAVSRRTGVIFLTGGAGDINPAR